MAIRRFIAIGLALCAGFYAVPAQATAADSTDIEQPVVDQARVLSSYDEDKLARLLVAHRVATGVQIAVVLINSTYGVPIEDFSIELATAWGGGSAKRSDGLLLLLAISDRRSRIEVGYDLEAKVPDHAARQILDAMKPALRDREYAAAIQGAVAQLINRTGGFEPVMPYTPKYNPSASAGTSSDDYERSSTCENWPMFLFFVIAVVFALVGAFSDNSSWSGSSSSSLWDLGSSFSSSSSSSSSSWGSSSSSSSSSSSYSSNSSSWSGGGGSFGGGGASSSW